jgi:hypothetical protein
LLKLLPNWAMAQESPAKASSTVQVVANVPDTKVEVAWTDGKLSADLKNADLNDVLAKIGRAIKAQVDVGEGIPGVVSLSFSGLPLEDALARLIQGEGAGIVLCYDQGGTVTLIRVSKRAGASHERVTKVRKVRSYFSPQDQAASLSMDRIKELMGILRDSHRKGQWVIAAKQIINIKNPEAKPYLKELMTHEDDFVRDEALWEYAMLVDAEDADFILDLAEDKSWRRRAAAAEIAMRLVDDPRQIPVLMKMVQDKTFAVQDAAIKTLGAKKTQAAIPVLEELLRTGNADTRASAAAALYRMTKVKYEWRTPEEKAAFEEELRESDERMKRKATEYEKQAH